ncbi:hypothetical protein DBR32_04550 [Taibaiella sp. KBW10]|uniref:hypothetical protein n=1 Tax=Taibaiella sp. KBW10 TaxID=2153357 RepID=UPI000F591DC7|nr:hypothetical protein [Taibaiella sp. KBW10]RQO31245.1 hypothetical protein DBR32_04550 [Taibaiella sp. KBW10]
MVKKQYLLSIGILLWSCFLYVPATAQHMYGSIYDDGLTLDNVVLTNLNSGNGSISDAKGLYRLSCRAGDSIRVSLIGYNDVILYVPTSLKGDYFRNIELKPMSYMLESVEVSALTPYQRDSMARRNLYGQPLSREWVSGPKAIFSPMTYFAQKVSKKAKQRRAFQLNYGNWENQQFIDSRYTKEFVGTVVPLQGDTLAYFMNAYPIAPDFARAATDLELKMWIKYNYLEWVKKPEIPVFTSPKRK